MGGISMISNATKWCMWLFVLSACPIASSIILFVYQQSAPPQFAFPYRDPKPWSAVIVDSIMVLQLFVSIPASIAVSRMTNRIAVHCIAIAIILVSVIVTIWNAFFAQMVLTGAYL